MTGGGRVGFGFFAGGDLDDPVIAAYASPEPACSVWGIVKPGLAESYNS